MNGTLIRHNLRHFKRLIPALVLGCFALEVLIVHVAAAFGPQMFEMFEALPPAFRAFVGGQLMNQLSFKAFLAFGFQHPASLAMGLSLVVLSASLPAAERETGFLDLVLARPVPRGRYLAATVVSLVVGAVVIPLAQLLGLIVGLATVDTEEKVAWTQFVPTTAGMAALFLAFGGVTLFFAAGARRRGIAASRAVAVILVTFVLQAFVGIYPPLENVSWVSPFHYFQPIAAAMQGTRWGDLGVLGGVFGVATVGAFVRFRRRDL